MKIPLPQYLPSLLAGRKFAFQIGPRFAELQVGRIYVGKSGLRYAELRYTISGISDK